MLSCSAIKRHNVFLTAVAKPYRINTLIDEVVDELVHATPVLQALALDIIVETDVAIERPVEIAAIHNMHFNMARDLWNAHHRGDHPPRQWLV